MSDRIGPELAAEVARRAERHPYADHPAALVLADHIAAIGVRAATSRAVCECGWRGAVCDYPAHLAEMLHRAGLLAPRDVVDNAAPRDGIRRQAGRARVSTRDPHRTSPRREGRQEDDMSIATLVSVVGTAEAEAGRLKPCRLLVAPDPAAETCTDMATWEILVRCATCGREGYTYACNDHKAGAEGWSGSHPPCPGPVVLITAMPLA